MSEAGSWSNTPLCETDRGQDTAAVFALGSGRGRLPVTGELMSGWFISYQGNQQRGPPLTAPLISYPGG